MARAKKTWTIKGPSPAGLLHDDGGDYAIIEHDEMFGDQIIGEAYRRTSYQKVVDAKENALLFAGAPRLLAVCEKALPKLDVLDDGTEFECLYCPGDKGHRMDCIVIEMIVAIAATREGEE